MAQSGAPMFLWALVGVMTTIELWLSLSSSHLLGVIDYRQTAWLLGAFWQPVLSGLVQPVYPGQKVLMFVTYAFLHSGLVHLVVNSAILLALGKFISSQIGTHKTLLVLSVSTITAAAFFGLISTSNEPMIGASGAVFGLIGAWQAVKCQLLKNAGASIQPVVIEILGLIIANILVYTILSGRLAWETHLGGWLTGGLLGFTFNRHQ